MTFELVRFGWPNVVALIALAALPFIALGLPAEQPKTYIQIERADDGAQSPIIVASGITFE